MGSDLRAAFEALLDQLLRHQFPALPEFERDVKESELVKVRNVCQAAAADPKQRTVPEKPLRPLMRQFAMPLELGEQHEAAFLLKDVWKSRFLKAAAAEEGGPITVGKLRASTDQPKPRGLPREMQNLLVLTFADQTGKRFVGERAEEAPLSRLEDEWELCDQQLPTAEEWATVQDRAGRIFGVVPSKLLNAHNVAELERILEQVCASFRGPVCDLPRALEDRAQKIGGASDTARQATADEAMTLLESLRSRLDDRVFVLARADMKCPLEALGRSMKSAEAVVRTLRDPQWSLVDGLAQLTDERRDQAESIRASLVQAMGDDEYVTSLADVAKSAWTEAIALLAKSLPDDSGPVDPKVGVVSEGARQGLTGSSAESVLADLREQLDTPGRTLDVRWTIRERADEADA